MMLFVHALVSFVAVIAFAILFHAPRNQWIWCGLTGMAGWCAYQLALWNGLSLPISSFIASMVLALLARIFAVTCKCPSTVFLTGGIFPLVPGAGIYYTVYYFIMGEGNLSFEKGIETIKIAAAIAIGIVLVFALPAHIFKFFVKCKKSH